MIRSIGPEDVDAVAAVEAAAAAWPWSRGAVAASLHQPTTRAWAAWEHDRAVGHLLASVVADTGEILTIAVHPDARRRGWARRLLAACAAQWAEEGVAEAFLEVRAGNQPAIALYRGTGWHEVGRRRAYYPDGEDAVVMRWAPC